MPAKNDFAPARSVPLRFGKAAQFANSEGFTILRAGTERSGACGLRQIAAARSFAGRVCATENV